MASISTTNLLLWVGEFVGFILLIALLATIRFGTPKRSTLQFIGKLLDERAARIDAQLKLAEESRVQAREAHEQAQAEIARAHEEAQGIVERAQNMTVSLREELLTNANEERDRIVAQARDAIDTERNRAVLELRTHAADMAVEAAREVLRQTMDASTDRGIIQRTLTEEPVNGDSRVEPA